MVILNLILNYLGAPILWLGILAVIFSYNQRIKKERKQFRVAINKDFFEARIFIKYGILFTLVGSVISMILGITLPNQSIIIYQLIVVLACLLKGFSDISLLISMLVFFVSGTIFSQGLNLGNVFNRDTATSWLALIFVSFILEYILIRSIKKESLIPELKKGKRGRKIVNYYGRQITVFPMLILVPTGNMGHIMKFWPMLNIGNQSFTLAVLPFLMSVGLKVTKLSKEESIELKLKDVKLMAILSLLAVIGSFIVRDGLLAIGIIALMLFIDIYLTIKRRNKEKQIDTGYVQTDEGIRIIAVRPDTPADKMNLHAGDTILTCNNIPVNNEDEFYRAIQKNAAYCHIKAKTYGGDLIIVESAIFNDSPHEIGLVLFH